MKIKLIDKNKNESNFPFWVLCIANKGYFPYNMHTFKTVKDRQKFINSLKIS